MAWHACIAVSIVNVSGSAGGGKASMQGDVLLYVQVVGRQPYDQQCDVWSCGIVAYQLLSGSLPFSSTGRAPTSRSTPTYNQTVLFDKIQNEESPYSNAISHAMEE